jgi:hypothetical protein
MASGRWFLQLGVVMETRFQTWNDHCAFLLSLSPWRNLWWGMDEFEEEKQGQMSHEEILRRFNKLFCREMTAVERRAFFLNDPLPPEEEKV